MKQLSPLWSVFALVVVMTIGLLVERRTRSSHVHPLEAALATFRTAALAFCAAAVLLWFSLPSTPVLASFGYPQTLDQIREPRLLLELLQAYNRALVRTTEVLSWFMFIIVLSIRFGDNHRAHGYPGVHSGASADGRAVSHEPGSLAAEPTGNIGHTSPG
jgi:hypothetical protein